MPTQAQVPAPNNPLAYRFSIRDGEGSEVKRFIRKHAKGFELTVREEWTDRFGDLVDCQWLAAVFPTLAEALAAGGMTEANLCGWYRDELGRAPAKAA